LILCGPGSSVNIVTGYGLDCLGIKSQWGRDFSHTSRPGAHPASCTTGTGSFLGVKRPGHGADHPPPSWHRDLEWVELYLYSHSRPLVACYRVTFTYFTFDSTVVIYYKFSLNFQINRSNSKGFQYFKTSGSSRLFCIKIILI
jgi:hypothetical protein